MTMIMMIEGGSHDGDHDGDSHDGDHDSVHDDDHDSDHDGDHGSNSNGSTTIEQWPQVCHRDLPRCEGGGERGGRVEKDDRLQDRGPALRGDLHMVIMFMFFLMWW